MIIVQMNEDIRKKETKFMGSFTFRQVLCLAIAAGIAAPIIIFVPGDIALRIILGLTLAIPIILCGWVKSQGQKFETLAIRFIYKKFLTPQKRKKRDMSYVGPRKALKKEKEKQRIRQMPKAKREEYLKAKKKGITLVKYSKRPENKVYR